MPTSKNTKPANDHPEKDDVIPPPDLPAEIEVETPVVPLGPTMGRSALGVKEVIPFAWKVVGRSGDVILTLFKSIERPDCEAQLARLAGEGYYTELSIMENSAVIVQPKAPDAAKGKKSKGKEAPDKHAAPSKPGKAVAPAPAGKKVEKPAAAKPAAKPPGKAKEPDRKVPPKPVAKKKEPPAKKSKPGAKTGKKK